MEKTMYSRRKIRTSIAVILAVAAVGGALSALSEERVEPAPALVQSSAVSVDATIAFYEDKVRQHPTLFAGFAALGSAYLDKARDTHNSAWLGMARNATTRSLEMTL
jgi:hypothetical protein